MAIEILFFGSLVDGTTVSSIHLDTFSDTDTLKLYLEKQYPTLQSAKYFMALNQQILHMNSPLVSGDSIACMPPFSGG